MTDQESHRMDIEKGVNSTCLSTHVNFSNTRKDERSTFLAALLFAVIPFILISSTVGLLAEKYGTSETLTEITLETSPALPLVQPQTPARTTPVRTLSRSISAQSLPKVYPSSSLPLSALSTTGLLPRRASKIADPRNIVVAAGVSTVEDARTASLAFSEGLVVYAFDANTASLRSIMPSDAKQAPRTGVVNVPADVRPASRVKMPACEGCGGRGADDAFLYLVKAELAERHRVSSAGAGEDSAAAVGALQFSQVDGIRGDKTWVFRLGGSVRQLEALQGAAPFLASNAVPFVSVTVPRAEPEDGLSVGERRRRLEAVLGRVHGLGYTCYETRGAGAGAGAGKGAVSFREFAEGAERRREGERMAVMCVLDRASGLSALREKAARFCGKMFRALVFGKVSSAAGVRGRG